ncbi:hypothetical protein sos41_01110 [Alphaproteobacteria bacterium SO-S41]|nr:hypothetical protein sos41_01110 [Alphaproteobacteria bacterium SO-S41]
MKTSILLAAALALGGSALAQSRDFVVTNESDYAVTSFQTGESQGWSKDWIPGDIIAPGEKFAMNFTMREGACVLPTLVTFDDGSTFDVDVDYCVAAHLILHNDTIDAE